MFICKHKLVKVQLYKHVFIWRPVKNIGELFSRTLYSSFSIASLIVLEIASSARLDVPQAPGIPLSFFPQHWGCKHMQQYLTFLHSKDGNLSPSVCKVHTVYWGHSPKYKIIFIICYNILTSFFKMYFILFLKSIIVCQLLLLASL